MKILTVTYGLGIGGVARISATMAISYSKLGADSRVLSTNGGGSRAEDLKAHGIPLWIGIGADIRQEIIDWNPDAVHMHSHAFGDREMEFLNPILAGRITVEKNVFSRPVAWTARMNYSYQLSNWCAWRFINCAPELAKKVVIISNGADTGAFAKVSPDEAREFKTGHGIPAGALVIGRIGQHFDTKWSPVLIEAFNRLCKKHRNLFLLLVNPSAAVQQQAKDSLHSDRIVIIERIVGDRALSVAYSAMDVFALAADQGESFGNVLAEAMLCEVPVVALSTPWQDNSQGEVVGNNVGGLIALTPKGFRRAIDTLLKDAALRSKLGRAGRARIIERFDTLKEARTSLDAIAGRIPPVDPSVLDRQILALYRDAFEKPSPLTLWLLKDKRFLRLTRYTTHYWPIHRLLAETVKILGKRIRPAGSAALEKKEPETS